MYTFLSLYNQQLFLAINKLNPQFEVFNSFFVILANYLPVVYVLVLLYLWFKSTTFQRNILHTIYSTILALILNKIISLCFYNPRPFVQGLGRVLIEHSNDSSFPSDHTTFMLVIAFSLLLFSRKTQRYGIFLLVLGIIGGILRIYVGVHYPIDIIGSLVVSFFSVFVILHTNQYFQKLDEVILSLYNRVSQVFQKFHRKVG